MPRDVDSGSYSWRRPVASATPSPVAVAAEPAKEAAEPMVTFQCPSCGATLAVEPKEDAAEEHAAEPQGA
jgi:predicted RNA-binding Zn-ribbon protein involved in translation (DUF1610 family)